VILVLRPYSPIRPLLFYSYHTSRHYPQVTPLIRILASSYVIMAVVANSGGTSPVNPTVEKYENPKKGKRKEHKTFPLINLLDNGSPKTQIRSFFFLLILYYHGLFWVYPHVFIELHKIYASLAGGQRLRYAGSIFV